MWSYLKRNCYCRGVADRFGMSKGNLHYIVMDVCHKLTAQRADVIRWPERGELQRLAGQWQEKAGIPGVAGSIDGTYIEIPGPEDETRDAYICRKGFPAMHLQVRLINSQQPKLCFLPSSKTQSMKQLSP